MAKEDATMVASGESEEAPAPVKGRNLSWILLHSISELYCGWQRTSKMALGVEPPERATKNCPWSWMASRQVVMKCSTQKWRVAS